MKLKLILALIGLLAIYAVLALAEVGVSQENLCQLKFPKWFGCVLAKHESLAGGLIGATGTILAGLIAWTAVSRQIANEKALQTRREEETYQVIQAKLRPHIGMYQLIWRVIDRSIRFKRGEPLDNGVKLARIISPYKPPFDAIEKDSQDLSPLRRSQLFEVINTMRAIELRLEEKYQKEGVDQLVEQERDQYALVWLHAMRAYLSHFERNLRAFDSTAAALFAGRTQTPIDARMPADQVESLVIEFEAKGKI